jgi:hypothetical protein
MLHCTQLIQAVLSPQYNRQDPTQAQLLNPPDRAGIIALPDPLPRLLLNHFIDYRFSILANFHNPRAFCPCIIDN